MLAACATWQPPAPDRPLKTIDLLIDTSVMPAEWKAIDKHEMTTESHHLSVGDSATIAFELEDIAFRRLRQEIHRYRNSAAAQGVYREFIRPIGDVPSEWTYQSAVADESAFACYDYEGRTPYPICEWSARCEEYIVIASAWLVTDHMSLSDLEKVIRAVEEQMGQQLGKP